MPWGPRRRAHLRRFPGLCPDQPLARRGRAEPRQLAASLGGHVCPSGRVAGVHPVGSVQDVLYPGVAATDLRLAASGATVVRDDHGSLEPSRGDPRACAERAAAVRPCCHRAAAAVAAFRQFPDQGAKGAAAADPGNPRACYHPCPRSTPSRPARARACHCRRDARPSSRARHSAVAGPTRSGSERHRAAEPGRSVGYHWWPGRTIRSQEPRERLGPALGGTSALGALRIEAAALAGAADATRWSSRWRRCKPP